MSAGVTPLQIQMLVKCRRADSLRQRIVNDLNQNGHGCLYVHKSKTPKRANGWAKIKGHATRGALNIEWKANVRTLFVRGIAEKGNTPHELLSVFAQYLMDFHAKRIETISIHLP